MNESGRMAAGAFSRPSIVVTWPFGVRITMKPPPPMPAENGSVTPSTAAAATVASTALPPRFSVSIAALVASASTVPAAPPLPTAIGSFMKLSLCPACAAGAASAAAATATAITLRIITLPPSRSRGVRPP